jgi:hypothetical protein
MMQMIFDLILEGYNSHFSIKFQNSKNLKIPKNSRKFIGDLNFFASHFPLKLLKFLKYSQAAIKIVMFNCMHTQCKNEYSKRILNKILIFI